MNNTLTRREMTELIWEEMDKMGLLFDRTQLPVKVGPDCHMIFATRCSGSGECKREKYYALTGGITTQIIKASNIL